MIRCSTFLSQKGRLLTGEFRSDILVYYLVTFVIYESLFSLLNLICGRLNTYVYIDLMLPEPSLDFGERDDEVLMSLDGTLVRSTFNFFA